jgi:hypothetical protein
VPPGAFREAGGALEGLPGGDGLEAEGEFVGDGGVERQGPLLERAAPVRAEASLRGARDLGGDGR